MECRARGAWLRKGQQVLTKSSPWPQALDYETRPACNLVIAVENEELLVPCEAGVLGTPGRKAAASATVLVQVTDSNDPPVFHPRSLVVREVAGARPGTRLGRFNATDPEGSDGQIR